MNYVVSVELDQMNIEAENGEEALDKAKNMLKNNMYSLVIVDREDEEID